MQREHPWKQTQGICQSGPSSWCLTALMTLCCRLLARSMWWRLSVLCLWEGQPRPTCSNSTARLSNACELRTACTSRRNRLWDEKSATSLLWRPWRGATAKLCIALTSGASRSIHPAEPCPKAPPSPRWCPCRTGCNAHLYHVHSTCLVCSSVSVQHRKWSTFSPRLLVAYAAWILRGQRRLIMVRNLHHVKSQNLIDLTAIMASNHVRVGSPTATFSRGAGPFSMPTAWRPPCSAIAFSTTCTKTTRLPLSGCVKLWFRSLCFLPLRQMCPRTNGVRP